MKTALLHRIAQAGRIRAACEFERASRSPEAAQRARLAHITGRAAQTEYGRMHRFGAVRGDPRAYRDVPIMEQRDAQALVTRMLAGTRNVLVPDDPVAYVSTSGTSADAPKYVAITEAYRREFQKTVQASLFHLYRKFPEAFRGNLLYFAGAKENGRAPDGTPVGTMSGFNYARMPRALRATYPWPVELFSIPDPSTRSFLAWYLAIASQTTMLIGIFPAGVVSFLRSFEEHADALAHAFRTGRVPKLKLDPALHALFADLVEQKQGIAFAERVMRAARLPANERCAALLPDLRLVYCWKAATAGAYVPELQALIGDVPIRDAIYSACEGWCNVPLGEEALGGPVAVNAHYYEFIDEDGGPALLSHELEEGRRYQVLLTTSGGLYRYRLGDVVEVTGRYNATPCIAFSRKAGNAANLVGEKLVEAHATKAVGDALGDIGARAAFFCLAPDVSGHPPGYDLFVEPANDTEWSSLAARADEHLGAVAVTYGRMRRAQQLRPIRLHLVTPGSWEALRARRMAAGASEAQIKVSHLVATRERVPIELREAAKAV